jgi:adenosylcobinamide hydrolase
LTDAGPHSKLGELICKCVNQVLLKALDQQSGISTVSQRDMLVRLDRFGIDEKYFWKVSTSLEGDNKKGPFYDNLRNISRKPAMVALISSILHLVDEVRWGLIPENSAKKVAFSQMRQLDNILKLGVDVPYDYLLDPKESIIENWVRVTSWIVKRNV